MTDKKSNQIEIIDFSGEQFSLCSIPCSISLLCLFLLATLNAILMVFYQGSLLTLILKCIHNFRTHNILFELD